MMVVVLLICLLEEELYFIGGLVEVEFDFIVEQVVASFLVLHSFEEVFFWIPVKYAFVQVALYVNLLNFDVLKVEEGLFYLLPDLEVPFYQIATMMYDFKYDIIDFLVDMTEVLFGLEAWILVEEVLFLVHFS